MRPETDVIFPIRHDRECTARPRLPAGAEADDIAGFSRRQQVQRRIRKHLRGDEIVRPAIDAGRWTELRQLSERQGGGVAAESRASVGSVVA